MQHAVPGGPPLSAGTSTIFYSHSQHMKFSRLCHSAASSWSMWCCSPHPQQVQETSSVLDSKTSSQVMFISLITGNSIAQSQKIATLYFTFFYFFLAHYLAHNMLCLGGPPEGGVCQLLFIVYKKRADRSPWLASVLLPSTVSFSSTLHGSG